MSLRDISYYFYCIETITPTDYKDYAKLLSELGEFDKAKHLKERVKSGYESRLGKEHPDTLVAANTVSRLLISLGDIDKARSMQHENLDEAHQFYERASCRNDNTNDSYISSSSTNHARGDYALTTFYCVLLS